ncbi:MAG: TetR/AcrR family transcriptional regulator [Gemmataceae bacterium]
MARRRGEVGRRRREQIIEAAVAIIAEEGLQHLSLSAIEKRADMSRGQLTYYFPTKEDILLAVFDHMIATMHDQATPNERPAGCKMEGLDGWERVQAFLTHMILHPPDAPEFQAVQYTFLSQTGHRDDFRHRLAGLYEFWRGHMANDLAAKMPATTEGAAVSARTLASFLQAVLHGLAIQRAADPQAYDPQEMNALCGQMLGQFLGTTRCPPTKGPAPRGRTGRLSKPSVERNHGRK